MPLISKPRYCPICGVKILGRSDKKFCHRSCKNEYHYRRRMENMFIGSDINKILQRNRVILQELYEDADREAIQIPRHRLIRKGFRFDYFTNELKLKRKRFKLVYDFAWSRISNEKIAIIRLAFDRTYLEKLTQA